MTEQSVRNQIVHRWYTRPVLFVADVNRALRFLRRHARSFSATADRYAWIFTPRAVGAKLTGDMQNLVLEVSNPETVHAIAETAKRQGTTPEAAALELLETAVLAQRPFEEIVEPIAQSFDESGMTEEELNDLVAETTQAAREERHRSR